MPEQRLSARSRVSRRALADDPHLRAGLNVAHGKVTYEAVARDLGYAYVPAQTLLN